MFSYIDQTQCSAHLINDGVTVSGDAVNVEWQGTGPSEFDQITDFTCGLDGGSFNPCKIHVFYVSELMYLHVLLAEPSLS